jgi:hypothetical protein
MLPDNCFNLEAAARRLRTARRQRATRFAPPAWPASRGPQPNPRRAD